MSKCKHKNIQVQEIGHEVLDWYIKDGKAYSFAREAGDIESSIQVKCFDCDFTGRFNRYAKSTPQWIRELADYIAFDASNDLLAKDEVAPHKWNEQLRKGKLEEI